MGKRFFNWYGYGNMDNVIFVIYVNVYVILL